MATLPNAQLAFVEPAKLTSYLLNLKHEQGGPKAKFLAALGFDLGKADEVEAALLAHGAAYEPGNWSRLSVRSIMSMEPCSRLPNASPKSGRFGRWTLDQPHRAL